MKTHKPAHLKRKAKTHKLRYQKGRFKELYASREWKAIRKLHLSKYPYCDECGSKNNLNVDHRIAHNGDPVLFKDPNNLVTLCHSHHSKKTATKDQIRDAQGRFKRKGE